MPLKRLSFLFITGLASVMFTILIVDNCNHSTEEMVFDPVSMSALSITHLVYLEYIQIEATARMKTI